MNIIFMEPVYKDYIWGGEKLKKIFNKNTPYDKTAESWEISANINGICKIKNEEYCGKTLKNLFEDKNLKEKIFGTRCNELKEFPLLIKFIDAKDNLSIQVHPDDDFAKSIGMPNGKNEMWYIIKTNNEGKIIGGLNTKLSKEELKDVVENDKIKEYLNYINIEDGDSIYIPAGTVHAILKHTLICEIQQNCDITYRIYDWDRKDKDGKSRPIHKKEAIETIKTEIMPEIIKTKNSNETQEIVESKYFEVEKINCKKAYKDTSNKNTFYTMSVVKGNGYIEYKNKQHEIKAGDSFLIPATLGEYKITGDIQILKAYMI